jgi:dTDP-4-amino-4,6-dideoxygalactose transaminase
VTVERIYLSPPEVTGEDRERLIAAVDSNWIAPVGPDLEQFEVEVASVAGRSFGVGLTSGTAALHLSLLEVGVRPGDEVLVPTLTFAATANAVRYCGATPIFVDCDPGTWQVSPTLLATALERRRAEGATVAAAITVDLYGQCADYDIVETLLADADVPLIEDAAEAIGSTYRGRPAGSFGAASVFSFNGNKLITTSGGGMLLTDDERLAARARYLATQAREPKIYYEHTELGFNYRLSNLLAAFGRGQLVDVPRRIEVRTGIFKRYEEFLAEIKDVELMPVARYGRPNYWLTCILTSGRIEPAEIMRALEEENIESRPIWKPMHLQPYYADSPAILDGSADDLFRRGLCLPSGGALTIEQQLRICRIVADVCR